MAVNSNVDFLRLITIYVFVTHFLLFVYNEPNCNIEDKNDELCSCTENNENVFHCLNRIDEFDKNGTVKGIYIF